MEQRQCLEKRKAEIDQKPSSPRLLPGFAALRLGVKFLYGADAGLSKRCPPKTEFQRAFYRAELQ
jgi:hypothetical protein